MALKPMKGNQVSSQFDVGYTELFHIPVVHQSPSRLVTVFLGTLWSSTKQIKAPYMFDWEDGIALHRIQANGASSHCEGEVSWLFSSCGGNLGYILELRWG